MKIEITQAHLAVLFFILFIGIGWYAPAFYAAYAPTDHFLEVHSFTAADTTTADDSHIVCFERTVHEPNSATVFTELYLVDNNDTRVEIDSRTTERYFQEGDETIKTPYQLPDNIAVGDYRYVLVVKMDLVQGRVTREFEYSSNSFTVMESDVPNNNTFKDVTC